MLKVKLLNDGGYGDMENVKFPVIVEGVDFCGVACFVLCSELARVGLNGLPDVRYGYLFSYFDECEVIDEE